MKIYYIGDLGVSWLFTSYIDVKSTSVIFSKQSGEDKIQCRSLKDWSLNWVKSLPDGVSNVSRTDFSRLISNDNTVPLIAVADNAIFFYRVDCKTGEAKIKYEVSPKNAIYLKNEMGAQLSESSHVINLKTGEKLANFPFNESLFGVACKDLDFSYPRDFKLSKKCHIFSYETLESISVDSSNIVSDKESFHRFTSSKNSSIVAGVYKTGSIDEVDLNSYRYYIFTPDGDIVPVGDLDMSLYYNFISPNGQDDFFDVYVGKGSDLEFRRYSERGELLHSEPIKLPKLNKHGYYSLYYYFVGTIQVGNYYVTVDPKVSQVFIFNKETFEHEFIPIKDFFQTTKKPAFVQFNVNSGMPYGDNFVVYQKKNRGAWCLAYISFDGAIPPEVQHLKECCEKANNEELPEVSTEFPW
jgi:hypothetical protein